MRIPIDQIVVSKDNPRQSFDEEGLRRLGESIREHGQLQPVIVRKKGSFFELVVGERRLRACALVGINEIDAEIRDVDDATAMELRLIENTQREDLTYAEKGDAVLALWALGKYETIKEVAEAIKIPYYTIIKAWIPSSRKLSPKLKRVTAARTLNVTFAQELLKYPHITQDKIADIIIKRGLEREQLRRFRKLYDANPQRDLNSIADEVLGIETITVPKNELPKETLEKIEEKKQLAKVQRIRKKPSKPITKEQVKEKLEKKADFKFVKAKVTHGNAGSVPPLKTEVKPTVIPNPSTPDYSLCKCALCPLFAKHCKGRCWT